MTYNHATLARGKNLGSQGLSGSGGLAKGFGVAYASLFEGSISGAKKVGNVPGVCGK